MVYKSILLIAAVAIANLAAAATPPACLLAAIGQRENIADFNGICGDQANDVQSAIDDVCKDSYVEPAQSAFVSACSEKGHSVAMPTPSASATSASPEASQTGDSDSATPTGDAPFGASGSPTNSASSPDETGAAERVTVGAGIAGALVAVMFAAL